MAYFHGQTVKLPGSSSLKTFRPPDGGAKVAAPRHKKSTGAAGTSVLTGCVVFFEMENKKQALKK